MPDVARFRAEGSPSFGRSNPERIESSFRDWVVRGEGVENSLPILAAQAAALLADPENEGDRQVIDWGYPPYRVREILGLEMMEAAPTWTLDRMGATLTSLDDGGLVVVAGEHEDFYDPDFHIYNDVIVFRPTGSIEFYDYPREVFPPTDFHTATRVGDRLILIGSLSYADDRRPGVTQLYALDLMSFAITPLEATGEPPGWISRHTARLEGSTIVVEGGMIHEERGDSAVYRPNFDVHALDFETMSWSTREIRDWKMYEIVDEGSFYYMLLPEGFDTSLLRSGLEQFPDIPKMDVPLYPSDLVPEGFVDESPQPHLLTLRLRFGSVPVKVECSHPGIEVTVEAELPESESRAIAERIRTRLEARAGRPARLESRF
ncbi:MAG: hypothetical protein SFX72_21520 [Isosphaeraceae bacterium]|nr:hypothetical protein [Isosphaeraceae bacterium]